MKQSACGKEKNLQIRRKRRKLTAIITQDAEAEQDAVTTKNNPHPLILPKEQPIPEG
jgi:hypothetical protein